MKALLSIGQKYGIPVIEDAAEAIGSEWHGKPAGSMGSFWHLFFSWHKNVNNGGGWHVRNARRLALRKGAKPE